MGTSLTLKRGQERLLESYGQIIKILIPRQEICTLSRNWWLLKDSELRNDITIFIFRNKHFCNSHEEMAIEENEIGVGDK